MSRLGSSRLADGAVRFLPKEAGWVYPFLARLAVSLALHPAGEAVLVERGDAPVPVLWPATPAAALAIRSAAEGLPGRLELVGPLPPSTADGGCPGRFALLVPAGAAPSPGAEREEDLGRPTGPRQAPNRSAALGALLPDEPVGDVGDRPGSAAVQCHWWSAGTGRLAVRVRAWIPGGPSDADGGISSAVAALTRPVLEAGYSVGVVRLRPSYWRRRAWRRGTVPGLARGPAFVLPPESAARIVAGSGAAVPLEESVLDRHAVVVGASGSGKTSFLADLARRRIEGGRATVVFDVHGDLGPAIVAGLSRAAAGRVLAIDATRPPDRIPGVGVFAGTTAEERERESAHLVAGFRHISTDGSETFWGHRLEQVFDVFVRLVEEEGGGFLDLYELLTEPSRQEAARLTTRRAPAARFLEQLTALTRRNPDYLQAAIARVQKVALQPKLARLFAPSEPNVPIGSWLTDGGSIVWRVPSSEVGPAGSRFAATLLASRVYLGLAARGPSGGGLSALLVFDEAQAIAPSLLAEILAEGRKFGVGAVVATQYAGRLAPEALDAAVGAAGTHVAFRVPRSGAAASGEWVGLDRTASERLFPALPTGVALLDAPPPCHARRLVMVPPLPSDGGRAWTDAVERTLDRFAPSRTSNASGGPIEELGEGILLALVGAEERQRPETRTTLPEALEREDGPVAPAEVETGLDHLIARGWVVEEAGRLALTSAGARRIGLGVPTGAVRESDEHRALLLRAYRVFARHGERLEIVRQGRYDTRLPDAWLPIRPARLGSQGAAALADWVDRRRTSWAWRAFGGRDVHVEAEVSGAEKPARIRRGLEKARGRGAAVVFVVSDARRARRVRAVLTAEGTRPPEAQVWTLSAAHGRPRKTDEADGGSRASEGPA